MVVAKLPASSFDADTTSPREPNRDTHGTPGKWGRPSTDGSEQPADVDASSIDCGAPRCGRVLQVLERGLRMLQAMELHTPALPPMAPDAIATPSPSACAAAPCWRCLTRPEAAPPPDTVHSLLEGAIRGAVLPRLRARYGARTPSVNTAAVRLADRLLAPSAGVGRTIALIETIARPYGWSAASCAPLFEACARNLGDRLARDACDDPQVTTALLTLQAALDSMHEPWSGCSKPAPAALVVTAPGEPHRLGAQLAARALQLAGWRVTGATPADEASLAAMVAAERFDVLHIALSPACRRDHCQARLARLIAGVRDASCSPGLKISVGGRLFSEAPAAWSTVGADTGSASAGTLVCTLAGTQPAADARRSPAA